MREESKLILERELVMKVKAFHRILESGMFSSPLGRKEASRWNEEITAMRKKLGITKREQTILVNRLL